MGWFTGDRLWNASRSEYAIIAVAAAPASAGKPIDHSRWRSWKLSACLQREPGSGRWKACDDILLQRSLGALQEELQSGSAESMYKARLQAGIALVSDILPAAFLRNGDLRAAWISANCAVIAVWVRGARPSSG